MASNNVQIGKWVYGRSDMVAYGKVLETLKDAKNGMTADKVAASKAIVLMVNGDMSRAIGKANTMLHNLRFRKVVGQLQLVDGTTVFRITNEADANEIIGIGQEVSNEFQRKAETAEKTKEVSAATIKNNNNNKVKGDKMATVTKAKVIKVKRTFLQDGVVTEFGAGRPSKLKLACECDAEGNLLNKQAYAEFVQNGGKSEDKLTKAELLDLIRKLRAENAELAEAFAAAVEAVGVAKANDEPEDSADGLDVEAQEAEPETAEVPEDCPVCDDAE